MSFLIDCIVKISVIMTVALIAVRIMRRQSAALRHFVLFGAVILGTITPFAAIVMPAWHLPTTNDATPKPASSVLDPFRTADAAAAVSSSLTPVPSQRDFSMVAVALWIAGTCAGLIAIGAGLVRLRRLALAAQPLGSSEWRDLTLRISRQFGLKRFVRLLVSCNPSILVTWGFRNPKVLLPSGAELWPEDRARVVLSHELAHIRRLDWLTLLLAEVLRAVYWFHPLVWMVCRRLRLESEHACDNAAMTCGIHGNDYAAHLLDLARELHTTERAWSSALPMARPSTVERRFEAMLNPLLNRRPLNTIHIIAITIVAFALALPIVTFSSSAPISTTRIAQSSGVEPGEEAQIPSASAPGPTPVATKPSRASSPSPVQQPRRYTGEIISVRLKNADVRDFFKFLADFTGKNFLVDADVQGPLTLTLNGVPWDQALDVVLRDFGLALVEEPSLVRVGTKSSGTQPVAFASAQATGRISGTLFDASTLPIPGVQVRLTSPSVPDGRAVLTDANGYYLFENLPPAVYRMVVSQLGFKTINVDALNLFASSSISTNLRLDVAPMAEEVTVFSTPSNAASAPQPGPPPPCAPTIPTAPADRPSVGGAIQQTMLINHAAPIYPQEARATQVQGVVVMEAIVAKDGGITDIKTLSGHPLLMASAVSAIQRWCYRPTLLNGLPVETPVVFIINFRLVN